MSTSMKRIFPGNFVNYLSTYQGQPVIAVPGRRYYHKCGYVKVTATAGVREFDVIIPSPDKRPDDKPRPDIVGLTVPSGALVYHAGLRIVDARKDTGKGTARSGLVWANAADRIKLASAVTVNETAGSITATQISTPPIDDVNLTAPPQSTVASVITPVALSGALTLKVYYDNGSTALGNAGGLTSSESAGSFLVAEVAYYLPDECVDPSDFGGLPAAVESL